MLEKTKFYHFEFDYLNVYADKWISKIIINYIIKDYSNLEKIIINFACRVNVMLNEKNKLIKILNNCLNQNNSNK